MRKRWLLSGVVVGVLVLSAVLALARHPVLDWVEGLIQRVEPRFRELRILDYRQGTST